MNDIPRIDGQELRAFCITLLRANGVDEVQAIEVADNLVWSELIGRENFGLLRLPIYLERVAAGGLRCPSNPRFMDVSPCTCILDADAGFGQYAARLATDRAISLARQYGTGAVGVRNSNFFGTGAYFIDKIASAGMIGLVMSNSFPKVTAHKGLTPVFGTNPLAFGAPRQNGESLMFDMATSALAGSTVREHIEKGLALPEGLAIDADGAPITDPAKVADGALLPAAGAKGYGLSLLVEILAGVLTGAGVASGVASMYKDVARPGQNGHFIIALDIARFIPLNDFFDRLEGLVAEIKASRSDNEILLPGEVRWRNYRHNKQAGIALGKPTRAAIETICEHTGTPLPWLRSQQGA